MTKDDAFIYLAAHDLRAPLMSVKGLLALMREDPEGKNLDHYFSLLERSIDKMNQSINDIIKHSQNGKVKISAREIDLRKVVEDSIQSLRFMKGAESVGVHLNIDESVKLISDYDILFSIVSNIISNAIRYRDSTKASFLKISASTNSEGVEIAFEDNGIGMDEATKPRIFDKFFLVNEEQEGTGLGLYVVKNSLEKLGGRIHVESELGTGTTFTLQIPNLSNWPNKLCSS